MWDIDPEKLDRELTIATILWGVISISIGLGMMVHQSGWIAMGRAVALLALFWIAMEVYVLWRPTSAE